MLTIDDIKKIRNSNTTSTSNAQNDGLTLEEVRAIRQKAIENEKQKESYWCNYCSAYNSSLNWI